MYNNSVVITFDFLTNTYTLQQYDITDNANIIIYFVFVSGTAKKNILFDNLSFGILLQKDNTIVCNKRWPDDEIQYVSTDQDFLEFTSIGLDTNIPYKLFLWTEYSSIRYQQEFSLEIPYIEQMPDYEVE